MKIYQLTQFRRDKLALAGRVYRGFSGNDLLAYVIGAADEGNASKDTALPFECRFLALEDAGDDTRPGGQVGSVAFAGATVKGRPVILYRVDRGDGRGGFESANYAGVGAPDARLASPAPPGGGTGGTTMDEALLQKALREVLLTDIPQEDPRRAAVDGLLRAKLPASVELPGTLVEKLLLLLLVNQGNWQGVAPAITEGIKNLQAAGVEV